MKQTISDKVVEHLIELENEFIELTTKQLEKGRRFSEKDRQHLLELDYKRHASYCTLEILEDLGDFDQ